MQILFLSLFLSQFSWQAVTDAHQVVRMQILRISGIATRWTQGPSRSVLPYRICSIAFVLYVPAHGHSVSARVSFSFSAFLPSHPVFFFIFSSLSLSLSPIAIDLRFLLQLAFCITGSLTGRKALAVRPLSSSHVSFFISNSGDGRGA